MNSAVRDDVFVVHPGAELYGSDRVLLESVSAFVSDGRNVTVALPERGQLTAELEARGAQVLVCAMPVVRKAVLRPRGFARFVRDVVIGAGDGWRLLRSTRPGLVYVNTLTIPLWLVLARARRIPTICHVHEGEASARRVVRKALALPVLLATTVIANSKFSVDVLASSFSRLSGTEVVLNAVPGPPSRTRARNRLDGGPRVAYLGRLSPRKGVDVAVTALALLHQRGIPASLSLIGSVFTGYEWYEKELREQVRAAHLDDSVCFHGFVDPIWGLVEQADIVVVPSRVDEPFGNTAVEAILAARPVVASATSGLLEAVAGYGSARLIAADDASLLADALAGIASDWPEVAAQAWQDAEVAERRHSVAAYRQRILDIADRTVRRGR